MKKTKRSQKCGVETCPSFRSGHLPREKDVKRLRGLSAPHVESFNYFLDTGLSQGIGDIEFSELALVDPAKLRSDPSSIDWNDVTSVQFWVDAVSVGRPTKPVGTGTSNRLYPRECRERRLHYAAPMTGTFCYKIVERRNGVTFPGATVRMPKRNFGNMPIMVMSKRCHLEGLMPEALMRLKEEVRDDSTSVVTTAVNENQSTSLVIFLQSCSSHTATLHLVT